MHFPENVTRLCGRKKFTFSCHPDIGCFTECCRDLELALTPYDVLRLCRELDLSATEFLDRYVLVEEDGKNNVPRVYLGMVDDGRASCPFISTEGCRVYPNRPGACRAYPVGRGVTLDKNGQVREIHVLVREDHCRGFAESSAQTAAEWFENQGLIEYNTFNDAVMNLLHHEGFRNNKGLTQKQKYNFLLALYRLDDFRKAVSSPAFQERYRITPEISEKILAGERSLLLFGIRWLQDNLFAETI